jgi:hypothetical protein
VRFSFFELLSRIVKVHLIGLSRNYIACTININMLESKKSTQGYRRHLTNFCGEKNGSIVS